MSLRDSLIAAGQPKQQAGKLAECKLGELTVYVRQLSARDVEAWQDWLGEQAKVAGGIKQSYRAKLIVQCLCDDAGKLIFDQVSDALVLSDLANDVIETLWLACRDANGMDRKSVEDAEKN